MKRFRSILRGLILTAAIFNSAFAGEEGLIFSDDFNADSGRWTSLFAPGNWIIKEGTLGYKAKEDSAFIAKTKPVADFVLEAEIKVPSSSARKCFGAILRTQTDGSSIILRYYDRSSLFEVLSYDQGKHLTEYDVLMAITKEHQGKIAFQKNRWYKLKIAVCGYKLYASLWPTEAPQPPGWQFESNVILNKPGQAGIVSQGGTEIEVGNFKIYSNVEKVLKDQRLKLHQQVKDKLRMEVFAVPFTSKGNDGDLRRIDVVTLADDERRPISGTILVEADGFENRYAVGLKDAVYGVYSIYLPEPKKSKVFNITFATAVGKKLQSTIILEPAQNLTWKDYVQKTLETIITKGTDRYGPVHTPLFMDVIDVYTLNAPETPAMLDDRIRTEDRPQHGRRSAGGSNLWLDQPTIKTMYQFSKISGDKKYAKAADAYIDYILKHCIKSNGMIYWGSHSYWNGYTESYGGDGVHETLIKHADWENMHRINPQAVKKEIDGFWNYHVQDKKTGITNRHDFRGSGDFAFSSGSFIIGFCFMYSVTGDQHYLDKAHLLTEWHYSHRSKKTGLIPESPWGAEQGEKGHLYWNGEHMFTQVTGCYGAQLLRSYELSGDPVFRDRAIGYMKAYEKYGWDEQARNYYAMIRFRDGKPVVKYDASKAAHKSPFTPIGYVNVWRTIMYTFEFPIVAAQASIYAYELSDVGGGRKDPELLTIAKHWAEVLKKNLPPKQGRRFKDQMEIAMPELKKTGGTYAENYGRAISFFVHLYRATGQTHYLQQAESLGREAVSKLYVNGLFKGHPAKPYYQANDGVGFLLWSLLELETPLKTMSGAF